MFAVVLIQKEIYKKAIEKFVENLKADKEIICVLVSGSYVHTKLDKHSDIDIHLILDESCDYRERGNVWIDGVEIEYFKNPPQQIRSYFKQETDSPHAAHMFVNSIVVGKSHKIVEELIAEAKVIIEKKPNVIRDFEKELSKYHLDDLLKDLEDCVINKDEFNFNFVKNKLIDESVYIFCRLKRIRRTKEKRLFSQLENIDSIFTELIAKSFDEKELNTRKIRKLVEYTENLLGGKRSKEWKLKSKLDL